jgi:hypothetical protein
VTTSGTEQKDRRRPTWPSQRTLKVLGAGVLLSALVIGGALAIRPSPNSSGQAAPVADEQATLPPTNPTRAVRGWPTTTQNPAGKYSWDGRTCAGRWCSYGFMHNGYASGDVDIYIRVAPEAPEHDEGGTAVTVAGHDGLYRRIDARTEEWIVPVGSTALAIRLEAAQGTSAADLAEAHAIIESMGTEPRDTKLGFRLVFTLETDDWDSG